MYQKLTTCSDKRKRKEILKSQPSSPPTTLNTYINRNRLSQASFNQNKPNTSSPSPTVRKSTFKKGVYCTNCNKEGHYGNECYKLVGYPPGHPLHNKYTPPSQRNGKGATINMVEIDDSQDTTPNYADPNTRTSTSADPFVHSRMDMLQNQLNQVLLML